ncbi:hypothetical protein EGH22_20385 [Halomicroarcula sp. F28]|uniref:hypothetical protein n=1 Tax=Haloarcula salinisoli TaxID=2487746 RepID=UPI001C73BBAF|nr:hypothetical protein [Halomicroarcula salinisoli]MBX0288692.1 hypothetical protein [Halomicroarcula salinisoli]
MSDRIDGVYEDASLAIERGETHVDGHPIWYLFYGYQRDTFRNLFPILVTYDGGYTLSELRYKIVKAVETSEELFVCAPGEYDSMPVDNATTSCHLKFILITPEEDRDLVNEVSESEAMRLIRQFQDTLNEQGNQYWNSHSVKGGGIAKFFLNIGRGHQIQLPFPTSPPRDDGEDSQLQTNIPCFILTDENPSLNDKKIPDKELVTIRWTYPLIG